MIWYYYITAALSIILLLIGLSSERNQRNVYVTEILIIMTISNLGYLALALSSNVEEALLANKIVYLGGCFAPMIVLYVILNICNLKIYRGVKFGLGLYSLMVYLFVLSIGFSEFYYQSAVLESYQGVSVLEKVYGPGHVFSTILLYGYNVISLGVMIYAYIKKKNISHQALGLMTLLMTTNIAMFFCSRAFDWHLEIMPLTYLITESVLLLIRGKLDICNVENGVALSDSAQQVYGYIVLDHNDRYMGSNQQAQNLLEELQELRVEKKLPDSLPFCACVIKWLQEDQEDRIYEYHLDDIHLACNIRKVYRHKKLYSRVVEIKDDSQHWEYVKKLEEATVRADAANQSKTVFLAHMSHEIRTPINAVLGMNEMILRASREPEIYEYASEIKSAAKSLLGIINDILDIAKVEAGKLTIMPTEYSLASMIKEMVNLIRFKAENKGLVFLVKADEGLPSVLYGDDMRIKQILGNLLNNAVKYTHSGSVILEVKMCEEGISFSVKDTGIGIRPEDVQRLYLPFERLEELQNRNIEGSGLGICISIQLLEMMNSELKVESTYGEGSEFSFVLNQRVVDATPIGKAITDAPDVPQEQYQSTFTATGARLMIVDDNRINRKVFVSLLKGMDIQVDEAASGMECLQLLTEKKYDMIFLDHMMPEMDGVETFHEIRRRELCDDTPIIMLTANAMVGERERFISMGFHDFLPKPIVAEQLEQMIRFYLPQGLIMEGGYIKEADVSQELKELPHLDEFDFGYAMGLLQEEVLLKKVLLDLYQALGPLEQKLSRLIEAIDIEEALRQYCTEVHSLKSTSAMVGALLLSSTSRLLEKACNDRDFDRIRALHPILLDEMRKHRARIETILPVPKEQEQSMDAGYYEMLRVSLESQDFNMADCICEMIQKCKHSERIQPLIDSLIEKVMNLETEEALDLIEEIKKQ